MSQILGVLHLYNGFFQDSMGKLAPESISVLIKEEMMGWQWHQLDHMQIICTLLQTDNHASTSPLSFYRPSCRSANSVKALKFKYQIEHGTRTDPFDAVRNMSVILQGSVASQLSVLAKSFAEKTSPRLSREDI